MSDTPRTDAAIRNSDGQWSYTLRETCEQLERELAEAREDAMDHKRMLQSLSKTQALDRAELDRSFQYIIKQRDTLAAALSMYGLPYTDDDLEHVAQNPSPLSEIGAHEAKRELLRRQALATVKGGSHE